MFVRTRCLVLIDSQKKMDYLNHRFDTIHETLPVTLTLRDDDRDSTVGTHHRAHVP